jgi:hypothetical protein
MKKIEQDRKYFKKEVWEIFCSKDFPEISDDQFVKTILHQAKKTYLRYERFYKNIGTVHRVGSIPQLKTTEIIVARGFLAVTEVVQTFKPILQRKKLELPYQELVTQFEKLSISVWVDWYEKNKFLIQDMKDKLVA